MAGFRGILDGSVEIGQAREARATQVQMQQMQIAAQMKMQQEQLRASTAQANADRSVKVQALNLEADQDQQRIDLGARDLDLKQQEFDSGAAIRELQQTNAKMLLKKAQAEFDDDQAMRASQTAFRQSAFGAGILSAMMNGVTATKTISQINAANGVPDGEPGSIVGMGGGPDGAWYDVVAADGKGGKGRMRQQVEPMALLTIAHSVLGEKGAAEWAQMYKLQNTENTRMGLAVASYQKALAVQQQRAMDASQLQAQKAWDAQELAKTKAAGAKAGTFQGSREKALAAEQTRLEASLTDETMLRDDAEKVKAAIAKIAEARKGILGIGDEPAGETGVPDAAKAAHNSASVRAVDGSIIVEENGTITSFVDEPGLRDNLKALGYNIK